MVNEARPAARLPVGFVDSFAGDVLERAETIEAVLGVYRLYGFEPLESPAIEYLDALGKHLPDIDQPDEGVFALKDDDESWIALRYDLTAPLARVFAQFSQQLPKPFRRYQYGPVWRREKPGPGRFRQFYQCDFDTVGSASVAVDAEVCAVLCDALAAAGISRDEMLVRVNNRKILNGVLRRGGIDDAQVRLEVLRAVDKLDRLGLDGVTDLLGAGRRDPSGDFTKGAGLDDRQIGFVRAFVEAGGSVRSEVIDRLADLVGDDEIGRAGVDEMAAIDTLLTAAGSFEQVIFDPTVVRGLAYYTGPVFEAELTFDIVDEDGRTRSFGSVAGGGRYDDLVRRFTGADVPACGASIGVDRLLAAVRARRGGSRVMDGPVVVTIMNRDRIGEYQSMVAELRRAGIRAEMYMGTAGFQRQMKYADKRRSPAVVIAGDDEFAADQVVVKDLAAGAARSAQIESRDEWRADRSAQRTVGRSDLVAAVRAVLGGDQ